MQPCTVDCLDWPLVVPGPKFHSYEAQNDASGLERIKCHSRLGEIPGGLKQQFDCSFSYAESL